jgi:hypothetical protein
MRTSGSTEASASSIRLWAKGEGKLTNAVRSADASRDVAGLATLANGAAVTTVIAGVQPLMQCEEVR